MRRHPYIKPVLGVLALATGIGFVAALASPAQAAICRVPRPKKKLSAAQIVALAKKYARGLPPSWIVATILIESNGYVDLYGDCKGCTCKSIGLMQVNTVAHAKDLKAQGFTRKDMFNPEKNVAMGTWILRKRYDEVLQALAGRAPRTPLGTIVRLAYKGPAKVMAAIKAQENVRNVYPDAAAKWDVALVQAGTLV